jgi:hypothetical protein
MSPLSVVIFFRSNNGKAEHDAWTASTAPEVAKLRCGGGGQDADWELDIYIHNAEALKLLKWLESWGNG